MKALRDALFEGAIFTLFVVVFIIGYIYGSIVGEKDDTHDKK